MIVGVQWGVRVDFFPSITLLSFFFITHVVLACTRVRHVTAVLCDTVDSDSSHAVVPKHFMTPLLLSFVIVSPHAPCCAAWLQ